VLQARRLQLLLVLLLVLHLGLVRLFRHLHR
jgi:hypothetical protein